MYWNLSSIHFPKQEFREPTAEVVRWTYVCENSSQLCNRRLIKFNQEAQTLQTCQMSCGIPPLWPKPTGQIKFLNRKAISFSKDSIKFRSLKTENFSVKRLLIGATDIFLSNLKSSSESRGAGEGNVDIFVTIIGGTTATALRLDVDESYKLEITSNITNTKVSIKSATLFGARHALETLSQLIWFDDSLGLYKIVTGIKFEDIPAFKYRGIMLDTGSNFISVDGIKRTLNAMAMNKLNTLHWHITNELSFPFCYENCEYAKYGAASSNKIYKTEEITEIMDYATMRGIRVVLEFNNNLDDLGVLLSDIFDRRIQFEKSSHFINSSDSLEHIKINGIHSLVPEMIHLGGVGVDHFLDENNFYSIEDPILSGYSAHEYVSDFQSATPKSDLLEKLKVSKVVLWPETLEQFKNFSKTSDKDMLIVHVSSESSERSQDKFFKAGYKVIISHSDVWFLNRLLPWSAVYAHRPWQNYSNAQTDKILGAEVCLWTENIDENSLDARLWPNAAAFAEVVWSNFAETRVGFATDRLDVQRQRMLRNGIMAAPIQPQWCSLNPGECS
uniref:beta-N-acetylhexosaminidase n=1 Tax=Sogatella furcifera TaxID=113103 RepID=A0AAU8L0F2_SOGFU